MAYSDYVFDPTGESPDNLVSGELHTVDLSGDVSVFTEHGPFFGDSIVVEGRKNSGAWSTLIPESQYGFSPLFLNASARTTRQRVFSYIVLNQDAIDVDEIRLTYQALGGYEDSGLLIQVATSTFDRSNMWEWAAFHGNAIDFSPQVRDQALVGVSPLDIIQRQLTKITEAIVDPYSGGVSQAVEISRLALKVENAVLKTELEERLAEVEFNQAVSAGVPITVYTTKAGKTSHRGAYVFRSNAGDLDAGNVATAVGTGAGAIGTDGVITSNGSKVAVSHTQNGTLINVIFTPNTSGVLKYKVLADF